MGTSLTASSAAYSHVILDSGTSLMGVNATFFHDVMAALLPPGHSCKAQNLGTEKSASWLMMCPCSQDIRPLTFTFDGTTAGDVDQFKVVLTKDDLFWEMDGVCVIKLQGLTLPAGVWLLGDVFLRKAYIVHDIDKLQVTFFLVPGHMASTATLALDQGPSAGFKTFLFLVVPAAAILAFALKLRRGARQAKATTGLCQDLEGRTEYIRLLA